MSLTTKMWLRKGCAEIYTKKNAHLCRADDGHRWQFVWAQDGMAVSGGGMPYGEIDTNYADGWHNMRPLQLPMPDRPFEQFHIIRKKYDEAMSTPAIYKLHLKTLVFDEYLAELRFGDYRLEISAERLNHIIEGLGDVGYVHTADEVIFWVTNGKRFALLGVV